MNWVLILLMLNGGHGSSIAELGPYASSSDCEKAYAIVEQSNLSVDRHACVPTALTQDTYGPHKALKLPEEFD